MTIDLRLGDCVEVMRTLPDASVDSVVTDPPYGLEFMGKDWDAPWKARGENPASAGFSKGGFATNNGYSKRQTPSYGKAWQNKRCQKCWHIASGGSPCHCPNPEWVIERGDTAAPMRAFQDWCEAWAAECFRVLKPGGHLLAFGGTRTYHRMAVAIEDAGFEIRDSIHWIYGSGFPKSLDVSKAINKAAGAERKVVGKHPNPSSTRAQTAMGDGWQESPDITAPATDAAKQWSGWGTALKPAHEPVVVARKPLVGTVAENVLAHGTGALNIDGCRVGVDKVVGQRLKSEGWEHGENLCDLCAAVAGKNAKPETQAIAESIAARNAARMQSAEGRMRPARTLPATATECLNGQSEAEPSERQNGALNLSIAASGSKQMATSQAIASFITSMGTSSTTGLKTCKSCGAPITDMSITGIQSAQQSISADGESGIQNTKPSTPSGSASADNASVPVGRFPPNLLLSHTPECVLVGTRKVKTGVAVKHRSGGKNIFSDANKPASADQTYADANGTETIEAWDCAETCPVAELDRQGGTSRSVVRPPSGGPILNPATGWNANSMTDQTVRGYADEGGPSRFFPVFRYQAKASRSERGDFNKHPTVKPVALMRWLVRLVTPPGGVVLEPFMGSGTTGVACVNEGFSFIGIEREPEYFEISKARIEHAQAEQPAQKELFK